MSLHIKLPGELHLDEAHAIAEEVEAAIRAAAPEVSSVQTHLEPLAEESAATRPPHAEVAGDIETVARIVRGNRRRAGRAWLPRQGRRARRVPHVRVDGTTPLAVAHAEASRVEELIRRERPEISDVIVHTEP